MPRRPPPATVTDRLTALLEQPDPREGVADRPGRGSELPDRRGRATPGGPVRVTAPRALLPSVPSVPSGPSVGGWVPRHPDVGAQGADVLADEAGSSGWEDERGDHGDESARHLGGAGEDDGLRGDGSGRDDGGSNGVEASHPGRHRAPPTGPRLVSVPVSLDRARAAVSWPAVVGVAAVLIVSVVVFAVRVGAARATAQPRPAEVAGSTQVTRTTPPTGFTVTGLGPSAGSTTGPAPLGVGEGSQGPGSTVGKVAGGVVVDIAGLVVRPGVRTLARGARVTDALAAAGGVRPGADLTRLNLARLLVDGEQLYVPAAGQEPPRLLGPGAGSGPLREAPGSGVGATGSLTGGPAAGAPVDLNSADLAVLDGLPGVGPVLAQRIVDWRTAHGRFSSVDELGEVSGIGDKMLATLRPLVTV